jgi:hypothetical protein
VSICSDIKAVLVGLVSIPTLTVSLAFAGSPPAEITAVYATDQVYLTPGDQIYRINTAGAVSTFAPTSPGFAGIMGHAFDRANQRVVFLALDGAGARILSIDADFDPASVTALRTGLSQGVVSIDVDQSNGRIYWWELTGPGLIGEIRSVGPNGGGAVQVEAQGVPAAYELRVDAARGVYLVAFADTFVSTGFNQLWSGPLDGTASSVDIVRTSASTIIGGINIDPTDGDFVWTLLRSESTETLREIVRSDSGGTNQVAVYSEPINGFTQPLWMSIGIIGDLAAVQAQFIPPLPGDPTLLLVDTASGTTQTLISATPALFTQIDVDFTLAVIALQPTNILADEGDTVDIEVGAYDPLATFQWFRGGTPLADNGRITGTQTNKLILDPAEVADAEYYACRVTDSSGTVEISAEALLAIRPAPGGDCPADLAAPFGVLNFFDVVEYIARYNAGCP